MDTTLAGFGLTLFVAIALIVFCAAAWWNRRHSAAARRLDQRVRTLAAGRWSDGRDSIVKARALSRSAELAALLKRLPLSRLLDRSLQQAGLSWTVARFLALTLLPPVAFVCAGAALSLPMAPVALIALLWLAVPLTWVNRMRARRMAKIEEQLPEAADMISRALRAGHSFTGSLDMAGTELPEPIGSEFRTAFDEISFGVSMTDALNGLALRVPSEDMRYLVLAVLIQRESGGNLAEVLTNIGNIIRERLKLQARVKVLSAEGRLSGWILTALPFAVAGLMYATNPGFLEALWQDPAGPLIIGYALAMMAIGVFWMRKIVRIHI